MRCLCCAIYVGHPLLARYTHFKKILYLFLISIVLFRPVYACTRLQPILQHHNLKVLSSSATSVNYHMLHCLMPVLMFLKGIQRTKRCSVRNFSVAVSLKIMMKWSSISRTYTRRHQINHSLTIANCVEKYSRLTRVLWTTTKLYMQWSMFISIVVNFACAIFRPTKIVVFTMKRITKMIIFVSVTNAVWDSEAKRPCCLTCVSIRKHCKCVHIAKRVLT